MSEMWLGQCAEMANVSAVWWRVRIWVAGPRGGADEGLWEVGLWTTGECARKGAGVFIVTAASGASIARPRFLG